MRRTEIRKALRSRRGAQADAAKRAGVKPCTMSLWLKGKTVSDKIAGVAATVAEEIISGSWEKGKAA